MSDGLDALRRGEVVLLPTDTLVGLHTVATGPAAADLLRATKGAADLRPFLLLFAHAASVWEWARPATEDQRRRLEEIWPGPLTALLQPTSRTPPQWVWEGRSVGVRVPDHTGLRTVLERVDGPLYSTSANRSGETPAADLAEARSRFPDLAWIDLATGAASGASTIVDCTRDPERVVRAGAASWPPKNRK